jgi:hypothetical protein
MSIRLKVLGGGGSSIPVGTVSGSTLRWSGTAWVESTVTISSGGLLTATDISITTPSLIYTLSHNSFADYVAAQHIDWSVTGAEDIHVDRINFNDLQNILINQIFGG